MFYNEKGFSLVSVIIASGLIGVIALGLAQLMGNNAKNVNTIESGYDIVNFSGEIRGILSSTNACKESFDGANASNETDESKLKIKNSSGEIQFEMNSKIIGTKVFISNIALSDADSSVNVVVGGVGTTYLEVTFNKGPNTLGGEIKKLIKLFVETDPAGLIINCKSTILISGSNLWSQSQTNIDNIFYETGNVGIGNNNPTSRLHVNGAVLFEGTLGVTENVSLEKMLLIKGGLLKFGNGPFNSTGCSIVVEGSIKYNRAVKKIQFCNGSSWQSL